ncbi:hypothetical protein PC116_g23049 [Phytophthora cactorum]|uniref:Uncharacterized protein n=1 Tax=Phytophthora cactorum TaxID=29920 RepID=A0A8T1K064_9STRA|nr:hypothetical protein Pcac1_g16924 [Phytophthora cactorum]KAG2882811.1 hypothetical protein PC114_g20838 [Phytophthora cactorum]KAG2899902.1 hypothetical protein PC117_g22113 [Phytophthora cactorum]KAG2984828.1 hypothetical protein PC119_g20297 [Phytophthora cactorum]KAG3153337.1 hypothetical protein C6341_g15980 [Phytophthora cactorum]
MDTPRIGYGPRQAVFVWSPALTTTGLDTNLIELAKEERNTREGIGLQSPAAVLSSTWSSSLLLVGS